MIKPLTVLDKTKSTIAANPAVVSVSLDGPLALKVTARTPSREWLLSVTPGAEFGLPQINLMEKELIGKLAHVNYAGTLCYTDHEGLSLDDTQQPAIVDHALTNALADLETHYCQFVAGNFDSLINEFEGYWFSLPRSLPVDTHVDLNQTPREILALTSSNRNCVAFVDRHQLKAPVYDGLRRLGTFARRRAIYIPLERAILPPEHGESPSSPLVLNAIDNAMSGIVRSDVQKLLRSWPRHNTEVYLLVTQPRSDGSTSAFGIQWIGRSHKHPLVAPSSDWNVHPLVIHRHNAPYLRQRGGGASPLASKHVLVAGCGSIGARVAEHLALAGVGTLSLLDVKALRSDNLYRHLLGGGYCGTHKAVALSSELSSRLPDLKVNAIKEELLSWATTSNLSAFDAVVVAIGVPHVARKFIRRIRTDHCDIPVITTWLEPMGIGGHAQRTTPGLAGCLECLYTDESGASSLSPKIAFAESDQAMSRNLSGCVGSFTPYSAIDATHTALITARQVTESLLGDVSSAYDCWRGDGRAFAKAGFRATHWHKTYTEDKLIAAKCQYLKVPCPTCGGAK